MIFTSIDYHSELGKFCSKMQMSLSNFVQLENLQGRVPGCLARDLSPLYLYLHIIYLAILQANMLAYKHICLHRSIHSKKALSFEHGMKFTLNLHYFYCTYILTSQQKTNYGISSSWKSNEFTIKERSGRLGEALVIIDLGVCQLDGCFIC